MASEIERKYLVGEPPANLASWDCEAIAQGYLALDGEVEVRVRHRGTRCLLTIKSGSGSVRVEEELELDGDQFTSLWALTEGRRVSKTRYRIPYGDDLIELDVYEEALAGLCTAEVEFPDEAHSAAFVAPDWFGRELTDDPRYANRALALDSTPRH